MPPETRSDADAGALPEPPADALPALIEALLFVSDGPVPAATLARALNTSRRNVERACETLAHALAERGVRLQRGPDGAQIVTAPEASRQVEHFLGLEAQRRLSNASLETLAIVAYQQPVTRATIESIRGVNSDAAIATLRARELLEVGGHAPGPGRPALFITTQRFLEHFGLERPQELPPLDELAPPADAPTVAAEHPDAPPAEVGTEPQPAAGPPPA